MAAEVAGAAGAEVAAEAAASRGELAAGARADRFLNTLMTNSFWPGPMKSTRPMHVLFGHQAPAMVSSVIVERSMCSVEASPNWRFHSFADARRRALRQLHALTP